ncbi:MAG TPA: glycosyltransferase family 4 protein [Allosphingosinicella sp.]|nr:glycosyltransferase family 4 protein [Allosphingosinicella sp.]
MAKMREVSGDRRLDFAFASSNLDWGGSEDLWSGTALRLAEQGHRVRFYKNILPRGIADLDRLHGVARGIELARFPLPPKRLYRRVRRFARPLDIGWQAARLFLSLALRRRPDLAVISQGGNYDGWPLAAMCRRLGIDYALISHKASDLYWPVDAWRDWADRIYAGARHCFFVSAHSLRLTEEQLGRTLPRASIVRNPFRVPWDADAAWPETDGGVRLACVARLAPREKGQDLLLRVLALPKWRRRAVSVTFFGEGEQRDGLERMALYLRLANVAFAGQVEDVAGIWRTHQALVLPSRAEGLPLTIVETMLCGRVPIVTDVGGNAELLRDGITGFVADSPTEGDLDAALERAWERRAEWPAIGAAAGRSIRRQVPADPAQAFADRLVGMLTSQDEGAGEQALPIAAE